MGRKPITRANPYTPTRGAFAGQTFDTERQYRNALAKQKGFASWYAQQRAGPAAPSLTSLRPSERHARHLAFEALGLMRKEQLPLTKAAHRAHTPSSR